MKDLTIFEHAVLFFTSCWENVQDKLISWNVAQVHSTLLLQMFSRSCHLPLKKESN